MEADYHHLAYPDEKTPVSSDNIPVSSESNQIFRAHGSHCDMVVNFRGSKKRRPSASGVPRVSVNVRSSELLSSVPKQLGNPVLMNNDLQTAKRIVPYGTISFFRFSRLTCHSKS